MIANDTNRILFLWTRPRQHLFPVHALHTPSPTSHLEALQPAPRALENEEIECEGQTDDARGDSKTDTEYSARSISERKIDVTSAAVMRPGIDGYCVELGHEGQWQKYDAHDGKYQECDGIPPRVLRYFPAIVRLEHIGLLLLEIEEVVE